MIRLHTYMDQLLQGLLLGSGPISYLVFMSSKEWTLNSAARDLHFIAFISQGLSRYISSVCV